MAKLEAVAPALALGLGKGGGDQPEEGDEKTDLEDGQALAKALDDGVAA